MELIAILYLRKNIESSLMVSLTLDYNPDKLETYLVMQNSNRRVYQLLQDMKRPKVEADNAW